MTGVQTCALPISTNGTFVNGRQIKSAALSDADRIIVGTTNLEFQLI